MPYLTHKGSRCARCCRTLSLCRSCNHGSHGLGLRGRLWCRQGWWDGWRRGWWRENGWNAEQGRRGGQLASGYLQWDIRVYIRGLRTPPRHTPGQLTHLDFGADVRGAALRPLPDISLLLPHGNLARRSAQHRAGRQLRIRLSVRLFGEAEWCRFSNAGFSFHNQDGWRKDWDWKCKK